MSTKTPMTPDSPTVTPESIMQLGLGFWGSKTLLSAIELDLFTELSKEPLSAQELTARLQLHSRSARDFFDALVAENAYTASVFGLRTLGLEPEAWSLRSY